MLKLIYLLLLLQILMVFGDSDEVEVIIPDEKHVERPCKFEDMKCIKKLFKRKGWCNNITPKVKKQPADKPYELPEITEEIPALNTSLCQKNVKVIGLGSGKVVELFINKKTDRAVIAVHHKKISVNSSMTIIYNRPRQEPLVIKSDGLEIYKSVTITTVGEDMTKKPKYHPTTYLQSQPKFYLDDIDNVDNKEVIQLFEAVSERSSIAAAEAFGVRSPCFSAFFIQNVICSDHK